MLLEQNTLVTEAQMFTLVADNTSRKKARILVVEDVDFNQVLLADILAERGWQSVGAASGEAALDLLARDADFQIILMDIGLPGIDGLETTLKIKENPATLAIPVIALTAETARECERFFAAGLDGYVEKNFDPDQLFAEIEKHLPHLHDGNQKQPRQVTSFDRNPTDLDLDTLLTLCPDQKTLGRMATAFFADTGRLIARLTEAMAAGDRQEVLACCHGIRGTASIFTARTLAEAAEDLDACIRHGKKEADPALHRVLSAYESLRETVRTRFDLAL